MASGTVDGGTIYLICTTPRMHPKVCPVCQVKPTKGESKTVALGLEAHLVQAHAVKSPLHPDCLRKYQEAMTFAPTTRPPRWLLDWDVVRHGRVGDRLYFCVPCGIYAPDVVVMVED